MQKEKQIKKLVLLEKVALESKDTTFINEVKKKIVHIQKKHNISRVEIERYKLNGGMKSITTTVKPKVDVEQRIEKLKIQTELFVREEKNKYLLVQIGGTLFIYMFITLMWNIFFSAIQQLSTEQPPMNYWPVNMSYIPFWLELILIAGIGLFCHLKMIIPYKRWKESQKIKETLKGDSGLETDLSRYVD